MKEISYREFVRHAGRYIKEGGTFVLTGRYEYIVEVKKRVKGDMKFPRYYIPTIELTHAILLD